MVASHLEFFKLSGAGNDFIVADDRSSAWSSFDVSKLARGLCRHGLSIGADGLILLENSKRARFRMRHFNPDGGESPMCGNGARCAARFAFLKVIVGRQMTIETSSGVLEAEILADHQVRVEIPTKFTTPKYIKLEIEGRQIPCYLLDTGVPHLTVFVKDIERAPVETLGKRLRSHPHLGEGGANVNFVTPSPEGDSYPMRTFERGVERETLACGTGAAAVALVLSQMGERFSEIRLKMRSGRPLCVEFRPRRQTPAIFLTGDATYIYQGKISQEALEEALTC